MNPAAFRIAAVWLSAGCRAVLSRVTLCDPVDYSFYSLPGFSVHEIFLARILEWVAISSSRESSRSRDGTSISCVSCISGGVFYCWVIREAPDWINFTCKSIAQPLPWASLGETWAALGFCDFTMAPDLERMTNGQIHSLPNPLCNDNSHFLLMPKSCNKNIVQVLCFPHSAHSCTQENSNGTLLRGKEFPGDTEGNEIISLLVDIVCPH